MENGRVEYLHIELRDLRRYITERFDALEERLRAKADADEMDKLSARVAAIEANHLRWSLPRVVGGALLLTGMSAAVSALVTTWIRGG